MSCITPYEMTEYIECMYQLLEHTYANARKGSEIAYIPWCYINAASL
jgi:hypothetical protein